MVDGYLAVATGGNVPWSEKNWRLADVPYLWWAHEIMIGFTVMKPSSINCNNITVYSSMFETLPKRPYYLTHVFLLVGEILFHSPRLDRTTCTFVD